MKRLSDLSGRGQMAGGYGVSRVGSTTPRSVMMPVMRSAGVTSKAGL
jgi:hypothetical protein